MEDDATTTANDFMRIFFSGFAMPFVMALNSGFIVTSGRIIVGAALLWFFENETEKFPGEKMILNKVLKTDGENIIERK